MSGILLATHGSPGSDGAARVASLLAQRLGVPLTTLTVSEPMPAVDYGYGIVYVPTPDDDAAIREALLAGVRAQLARCRVTGCEPQIRTGLVVSEIAAAAHELDADMIVTGLGPHDFVDRALGGETALRLAQTATTPVLAIPTETTTVPRRVVVATDFSPTSRRGASLVTRWLRAGGELHLVHVTERSPHAPSGAPPPQRLMLATLLASLGAELSASSGVHIESIELHGNPARALLAYANRVDANLIVLGSHGYGALKRMLLGSVASKLIRLATNAVLVAPWSSAS